MRMPGGERAAVDEAKLLDYCLSTAHPRGRHKARLFAAATGITAAGAGHLREALLRAAHEAEAVPTKRNEYGQTYEVRFTLTGPIGTAEVLSVWIAADDHPWPRLVTCYPV